MSDLIDSVVIEMCDQGHKFAKLPDHPMRDGRARCPHCMAIGLDDLRASFEEVSKRFAEASQERVVQIPDPSYR